jgi:polyisoprenoid-binding protein YceI
MTADSTIPLHVPAPGTYRVDPQRSTLSYSGRHRFNTGTVHATFTISSGEIRVADPLTDSVVTVTVDAASFKSNSARRDKDVKAAKLLDVSTYPRSTLSRTGSATRVTAGSSPARSPPTAARLRSTWPWTG